MSCICLVYIYIYIYSIYIYIYTPHSRHAQTHIYTLPPSSHDASYNVHTLMFVDISMYVNGLVSIYRKNVRNIPPVQVAVDDHHDYK